MSKREKFLFADDTFAKIDTEKNDIIFVFERRY